MYIYRTTIQNLQIEIFAYFLSFQANLGLLLESLLTLSLSDHQVIDTCITIQYISAVT